MDVRLLDTFPHVEGLGPKEVIALGGFGTVSPKDFISMEREGTNEKVKVIINDAIARGYASMTTSVQLLFQIKGSRILDLYFTSYPFGSYMVLSQRYVPIEEPEVPGWVSGDVVNLIREEIKIYKEMEELGIRREEARGVVGLGSPTHMLAVLSVDAIASMKKAPGEHPEIGEALNGMEKEIMGSDVGEIYLAAKNAPSMGGPHPHPFHREGLEAERLELVHYYYKKGSVKEFLRAVEEIRRRPPEGWGEIVKNTIKLSDIAYRHALDGFFLFRAAVPLTLFNELKRHRTILMRSESIYKAMERGSFYIYPSVGNNTEAKRLFEWVVENFRMLDAPPYEKVYAVPQSIKIGVEFSLFLHHLLAPSQFFRIRACERAETSMKHFVRQIPFVLKGVASELFDALTAEVNGSRLVLPKCVVGACPEREFCPLIRGMNPHYNEGLHKKIKKGRKVL